MADRRSRFSVARLSGSGQERRRVLVIGDERFVSTGGESVADPVASLSAALSRPRPERGTGVDLDVLWDLAPAMRAIGGSSTWRLWRYDAVVVVVGRPPRGALGLRLQKLLARVIGDLAVASTLIAVFTVSESRSAESRSDQRRALQLLQPRGPEDPAVPSLFATVDDEGRLSDPAGIADAVLAVLDSSAGTAEAVESARALRARPQDEPGRQEAVDRSMSAVEGVLTDLERVVLLARNSFDVPFAQINLVSEGRLISLAFAGRTSDRLRGTLSELVVQGDSALLVPDTQQEDRFAAIDETRGPDAIRFYAGYPIESLDGFRVGVLCVFDTEPHPVAEGDDVLLRDVALLAEAEINALTMRRRVSGARTR